MNPFSWLRNAARNAVLGGIQDALQEAAPEGQVLVVGAFPTPPAALPAAPEPEPAPKPKKGTRAAE